MLDFIWSLRWVLESLSIFWYDDELAAPNYSVFLLLLKTGFECFLSMPESSFLLWFPLELIIPPLIPPPTSESPLSIGGKFIILFY